MRDTLTAMQDSAAWAQGVRYDVVQDEAEQIRELLSDVFVNGLQAMAAVFLILFLVLTWREGLIAGLAIPVTFAGALIVVLVLGYSLNELVIIGMVLALGLIVDVYILMMEGLHEQIYVQKKTFGQAALATIGNYAMPAFAGQLTTILAMAPLMAIGGVAGKFIRVLPITAITCLVIAYIVALLAAVPLSRYLLGPIARQRGEQKTKRADELTEQAAGWLHGFICTRAVDSRGHAWRWIGGAAAAFVLSLVAFSQIPTVLYPKTDGEKLGINIELPPATQLDHTNEVADAVGAILRDKGYFDSIIAVLHVNFRAVLGHDHAAVRDSCAVSSADAQGCGRSRRARLALCRAGKSDWASRSDQASSGRSTIGRRFWITLLASKV
ncbi:efflux RND transporter permease subunit [Erythrobacter sp. NFXS35]